MRRLTEILADAVLDFHLDELPAPAVARAQTTMKDCLGCLLAGSRETPPAILGQYARELGARPAPRSWVCGACGRTQVPPP